MKPARPDSAKSAKTRITIDSDVTSNNITQSRFSETYSNGVKPGPKKQSSDFEKYVAEKDKDPKFRRLLDQQLPQIPEQVKPASEISKHASKPFEKKISKNDKEKHEKKIEEPAKKLEQQAKTTKKQTNLQSSKTFIDKSKQKLKIPSKQQLDDNHTVEKVQRKQFEVQLPAKPEGSKAKINLNGFVLNVPGKPPQVIKQQKVQQKETEQAKQTRQRQRIMTEISDFVQEMEDKNSNYMPAWYDEFIDKNSTSKDIDIDKIQIGDYLNQPNQHDYDKLMRKINQNQNKLKGEASLSNSQISVNLEQIIDQSAAKSTKEGQKDDDDASVIMSSMSASDIRERNMFLTQILKGKRVTRQQMSQIKQNDEAIIKLIKLEGVNKEQEIDNDTFEAVEINMSKRKGNKIMERNKIEAAGQLYRQCDLLSAQDQQRIEDLINGVKIESPFELNEMQNLISRRIDEGIKLHRQLCQSIEGSSSAQQVIIDEQTLPKDPNLRKKAELNILRQKLNSVNSRLASVNEIVINSTKIQNLIKKYKEVVKPTKNSQNLIKQKNRQIQQQCKQLQQAELILQKAENEKEEILRILEDVTIEFSNMSAEAIRIQNMDSEQLRKMQLNKLQSKRVKVKEIQNQAKQFEQQIQSICDMREELKHRMDTLDQLMNVSTNQMKCEGYQEGETIENLDALITRKWQAAQEAVRNIPSE